MVQSNQRVQMIQARAGYRLRADESLKAQCISYDLRVVYDCRVEPRLREGREHCWRELEENSLQPTAFLLEVIMG